LGEFVAMDFQLMSIRTPRADSAKILKENAGETGSGPKFAGDEDKFFLEGIEEVLAQWEPEVGEMPPVDPRSLNLPHHPKPIIALSRKVGAQAHRCCFNLSGKKVLGRWDGVG
jgi:hypothetical protein